MQEYAYEDNDELYCRKLYQDYLEDTDSGKDEIFTLDECKKEWQAHCNGY